MEVQDKLLEKKSEDLSIDELLYLAEKLTYVKAKRLREIFSIAIYVALSIVSMKQLLSVLPSGINVWIILSIFCGMMVADFISGLVHWTLDTWGSIDTPVLGKSIYVTFREHHIDPTSFTRRDFIVTWGDICMVSLPALAPVTYMLYFGDAEHGKLWHNVYLFLLTTIHFEASNNQIHKWAHTHSGNPRWVQWLQKYHLMLPKSQHHTHHIAPHNINYCIVTGWANYPLEFINFWRNLEWIIERATGYKPRVDDSKWAEKKRRYIQLKNNTAIESSVAIN